MVAIIKLDFYNKPHTCTQKEKKNVDVKNIQKKAKFPRHK